MGEETVLSLYLLYRTFGKTLFCTIPGVGGWQQAMSVAVLADHFWRCALINTGSAGAVAPGLRSGDVVVASKLAYHNVDLTAFGYDYGQMSMQPLYLK